MSALRHKIRRGTPEHDALVSYIEGRLHSHRSQLESDAHPVEKVPGIRARISELKTLLQTINEDTPDEH
jgi:hypothetical protein